MADTVDVTVNSNGWTNISSGIANGVVSNEGNVAVKLRQSTADPGAGVRDGHTLPQGGGESWRWSNVPENIWARSVSDDCLLAVSVNA